MTLENAAQASLPRMPGFAAFYRAINGREPFPWQRRLAKQVHQAGHWCSEIGVPTGLGKTACLDIAIWWLASQAHVPPAERKAPTRIWWVVNRRLLVDSTFEHAKHIRDVLIGAKKDRNEDGDAAREAVCAVAERLSAISARQEAEPLEVIRLRGGVARGRPVDPSQPAVLLSTVPMYGSRLLFRGYGTYASMRPIDAALAGMDSLVLLDEAHLARHLPDLLKALAECAPARSSVLNPARAKPRLVALTATGDEAGASRFDLNSEDRTHPVISKRLNACKPMEIRCFTRKGDVARRLADATLEVIKESSRKTSILVFANTPATAREAFERLRKNQEGKESWDIFLLTGRMREVEAQGVRERILDHKSGLAASRNVSQARNRYLVVVATQTLEVGADIDAECLITEQCGVRALTQRLGRLNRLGQHAHARAVYVHVCSSRNEWPVYGSEPKAVLEALQKAQEGGSSHVEMSPARISNVLGAPADDPGRAPELLYGLLWEWLKTTIAPNGEAPVEPYFSGIAGSAYCVSVIWRVHVPKDGDLLWPRPRDAETVDIPIAEIREALGNDEIRRLSRSDSLTLETCGASDLRPGDQIVLPADRGLMDEFGWHAKSDMPVFDMSLERKGLPLDTDALSRLCGISVNTELIRVALGRSEDSEDIAETDRTLAIGQVLSQAKAEGQPVGWCADKWDSFIESLDGKARKPKKEVPRLVVRQMNGAGAEWQPVRLDEFDEMSMGSGAVSMTEHGLDVADLARAVASRLGVSDQLTEVVETASRLHDVGKADRRFQRWLDPDGCYGDVVLAKSSTPRHLWERHRAMAGWPRGGRHEALSARLVARWLDCHPDWKEPTLRELLLHLVISHHGKGRPLVVPVDDPTPDCVAAEIDGDLLEVKATLAEVDWSQPGRFRRLNMEFGPWGLALLEAILRQADHFVSGRLPEN